MYKVVFFDYDEDETLSIKEFLDKNEANDYADDCMFDYQDIIIDKNGDDIWKTMYRYYNPDDKETYFSCEIRKNDI
jgi:hypothetical protein